ncbi:MAG: acetyl-CoA acetyltransferase [Pseudomonadota bacterium]
MNEDRQPIIVGAGQATWRERDPSHTPIDAMQAVSKLALQSGGPALHSAIDAIVHVPFIMDQVPQLAAAMPRNPGAVVGQRLGIKALQFTADVGGNLPQALVNEFAGRLAQGSHEAVLLTGAELLGTFLGEVRSGAGMPAWESGAQISAQCITETPVMTAATERAHGLFEPKHAYPLFESAIRHARGLSADQHAQQLGTLVARMSDVAAANPLAWKRERLTPEQVLATENGNRMICYPYTKVMNSIIAVDQAAALVLTTVGKAKELGIDSEHWVYLRGAASAHDRWFLSERVTLNASPALAAAASEALRQARMELGELLHFDLYSCFPSAVAVACDALGLTPEDPRGVTVTGGMSLFGGPGNNYSLHAIATMVDRLCERDAGAGLVSANGGYLTKHSVGVYSRDAGRTPWTPREAREWQYRVDEEPFLELAESGHGAFVIDAHTVRFGREGPREGILLGRLGDGRRCVAKTEIPATVDALLARDCVGETGAVSHSDGLNRFEF